MKKEIIELIDRVDDERLFKMLWTFINTYLNLEQNERKPHNDKN